MVISSITYSCPFCLKSYKSKKSAEKCESACKTKSQKEKERVSSRNALLEELYTELTLKSTTEEFKNVLEKHIRKISNCPSFTIKKLNRYGVTPGHCTPRLALNIQMDFECSQDDLNGRNEYVSEKMRHIRGMDSGCGGGGGCRYSGSYYIFLDNFTTIKKDYEEFLELKLKKSEYDAQEHKYLINLEAEVKHLYTNNMERYEASKRIDELQREIDIIHNSLNELYNKIKQSIEHNYKVPEQYNYDVSAWLPYQDWMRNV
jgi:hypothetical protein